MHIIQLYHPAGVVTYHPAGAVIIQLENFKGYCGSKSIKVQTDCKIVLQSVFSYMSCHKEVSPVCRTKQMFVNYCNKGSQVTQAGSHGIEASYITVHSYDIFVFNTHLSSTSDSCNTHTMI